MSIKCKSGVYEKLRYSKECDFEKDIVQNADDIFGIRTIYVDLKKKQGKTIPDGYLIDLTVPDDPKMYVVENEIEGHDTFKHIGAQLLNFATSFDDDRLNIRKSIMENINESENARERLEEGCSESRYRNVDEYLDAAVYGDFRALVIIDEAEEYLHKVLGKIAADISVLEFKAYRSLEGDYAYEFDTLYAEDSENVVYDSDVRQKMSSESPLERQERLANCDTIVVPARDEGFKEVFLGEQRWHAIRIGAAMKKRIKYLAVYRTAPTKAVTHIAEIDKIELWNDTGKYVVSFKGEPAKIGSIPVKEGKRAPQGSVYVRRENLLQANTFEEAIG